MNPFGWTLYRKNRGPWSYDYPPVKISWSLFASFWHSTSAWPTNRQTDRQTDDSYYSACTACYADKLCIYAAPETCYEPSWLSKHVQDASASQPCGLWRLVWYNSAGHISRITATAIGQSNSSHAICVSQNSQSSPIFSSYSAASQRHRQDLHVRGGARN